MFEFSSTLRDDFAFKQHIAMATGSHKRSKYHMSLRYLGIKCKVVFLR